MIVCRVKGCRRHGWMFDYCPDHYQLVKRAAEQERAEREARKASA